MAAEKIFFLRDVRDIQVLQSLTWHHTDDATVEERDQLLRKLAAGEYVATSMFVPVHMLQLNFLRKGGGKI